MAAAASCGRRGSPSGELSVAIPQDITSLDPHAENTVAMLGTLSNAYEALTEADVEMKVRPALAVSWESPDPLTWVFRIRPSVRFHDGSLLTADDVVFSMDRVLHVTSLGVRAFLAGVAEVRAKSPEQVLVRTKWPTAILANDLAFVLIVHKGSTSSSLDAHPNGTGPYAIESWRPRSALKLRRHDGYWGPRPDIARATIHFGVSPAAAIAGVHAGRFQAVWGTEDVASAVDATGRCTVLRRDNIFLRHLAFDLTRDDSPFCPGVRNPFKNRAVRQAIQLTIDRTRLVTRIGNGAVPATQLVPRAIVGHDPDAAAPPHDLERARALLAKAGFARGFDVTMHCPLRLEPAARAIGEQLASIGIRVTVAGLSSADFHAALDRHEPTFWLTGSGCLTGDAMEILQDAFHSPDASRGLGVDNYAGFHDSQTDREIQEIAPIFNPRERARALQRIMRRLMEELIWIPLYHDQIFFIVENPYVFTPRADALFRVANIKRGR